MPNGDVPQFNAYTVLGIAPTSSPGEIRAAFRARSKQSHPDLGGTHEGQVKVNLAFEILSDPVQRQAHDKFWKVFATAHERPYQAPPAGQKTGAAPRPTPQPSAGTRQQPTKSAFDALYERVNAHIERERQAEEASRTARTKSKAAQYEQAMESGRNARQSALVFALLVTGSAVAASYFGFHWLWIGAILCWVGYSGTTQDIKVGNSRVSLADANWREKVLSEAAAEVDRQIRQGAERLRKYLGSIASLQALLSRSSGFDDSEEQVARRIAATLFLMGYRPERFDRDDRMLAFSDGEERILVRYRHRSGVATNVAYVRRMVEAMQGRGIQRGYLFCTPGLSGNGADLARQSKIKWYSLETMNQWIDETCRSEYRGPHGDILEAIRQLETFLSQISLQLPQAAPSRPRRRTYRRY